MVGPIWLSVNTSRWLLSIYTCPLYVKYEGNVAGLRCILKAEQGSALQEVDWDYKLHIKGLKCYTLLTTIKSEQEEAQRSKVVLGADSLSLTLC